MNRSYVICTVVVLACMLAAASAIRCYSCKSDTQSDCSTPAAGYLKDCGSSNNVCYKTYAKVGSAETYQRDCGRATQAASTLGDNACEDHSVSGVQTRVCNCNRDACNSAGGMSVSLGAATISILVSLFLAKF